MNLCLHAWHACRKICSPKHPVFIGKLEHRILPALNKTVLSTFLYWLYFLSLSYCFQGVSLTCLAYQNQRDNAIAETSADLHRAYLHSLCVATLLIHAEWDWAGRGEPEDKNKEREGCTGRCTQCNYATTSYFTTATISLHPFSHLFPPSSQALDFSSVHFVISPLHTFIYWNQQILTRQILYQFPKFKVAVHNFVEQNFKKEEPRTTKCIRNRSQESRTVCVIFKETQTDSKTAHQRDLWSTK